MFFSLSHSFGNIFRWGKKRWKSLTWNGSCLKPRLRGAVKGPSTKTLFKTWGDMWYKLSPWHRICTVRVPTLFKNVVFQVEKNKRLNSIYSIVSLLRDQIHSLVVNTHPRVSSAGGGGGGHQINNEGVEANGGGSKPGSAAKKASTALPPTDSLLIFSAESLQRLQQRTEVGAINSLQIVINHNKNCFVHRSSSLKGQCRRTSLERTDRPTSTSSQSARTSRPEYQLWTPNARWKWSKGLYDLLWSTTL